MIRSYLSIMEKKRQYAFILLCVTAFVCLQYQKLFSQTCDCSFTGSATWTVSGTSSTNYVLNSGQKLLINSGATYTGTITFNGGTVYNLGTFTPSTSSGFSNGYIKNCGTINWTYSPFSDYYINTLYIYNCQNGRINLTSGASLYIQYVLKNYGVINIPDGNFWVFQSFYNYATGKITQGGTSRSFENYGTLSNQGTIEALGSCGFVNRGCSATNTGLIKVSKDFFNHGPIYTECLIDVGRDFENWSFVYGPTTPGKWGQVKVKANSRNYYRFNVDNEFGATGYLDMCDEGHPVGGWDFTYQYFDYYVGYTTTYCQHAGNNCTNIPTYEVAITPSSPSVCTGKCVELTATVAGGTAPYTYAWSGGLGTTNKINVCPTTATSYTITVTDATGKITSASTTVTVNTPPTVTISGTSTTICPAASKTLTASGANTYTWAPPDGLANTTGAVVTASPTVTTTYTVTGTNTTTGCSNQATFTVNVHPKPIANAGNDKYVCPSQSAQLGGSPTASGGTAPYTYSWSPTTAMTGSTTATPTVTPTAITEYTVTVTDNKTCTAKDEAVVTYYSTCCDVGAPALSLQSYLNKIVNKGPVPNNNCITLNPPTDKTAWFAFVGDPTGGVTPVNETSCEVVYLGGGSYNYTTIWKSYHTNTSGVPYECTIKLAHPSSCYSSSNIKFLHSIAPHSVKNTTNGNIYAFTIKARLASGADLDLEGESSCKQITLDCGCDKLKPGFIPKSNCKGVAVQFLNTSKGTLAGTTYSWKFGPIGATSTQLNPSYTYTTAGTYTVELTVNNGGNCSKVISQPIVIKDCNDCQGGDQMLAFQQYMTSIVSHQTLSSSSCIKLLPPADRQAWCNFTGDAVCDASPPYLFHETKCESQTVNNQITYANKWKTVHINSNNARYECTIYLRHAPIYSSSSVSYFHSIAPDASKNDVHAYTMKARLANGSDVNVWGEVSCKNIACCDGSGITAGEDKQVCKGDGVTLEAEGGMTYSWLPVTGLSNPNIAKPVASPTVTTTYTVTITKPNCALSFTDDVRVEVLDKVVPNAGADKTICEGESVGLSASGGTTFEWLPVDGLNNPNIQNPVAKPAATTTYTVTVKGDNVCPIHNTDEVTVNVNKRPVITTGGDVIACNNDPVQISAYAPGATSYLWAPAGTLSSAIISNPMANPPVTTLYTVIVKNANNCISTASVTVKKGGNDDGTVCPTQVTCLGDSVQLWAAGGMKYEWIPTDGIGCANCANPQAAPASTTTYEVNITTPSGCVIKKLVTVVVKPKLELVVSPDISTCIGTKVTLNAAGAKDLHWEPAGILSCENCSSPSFTASKTTTFKVTGFDGNCTTTDSVKVTVDPAQNADFITRVINCSVLFVAVPSGMTKYEWDLGDPAHTRREGLTFEYSYTRAGIYNVTLWVTGSCGTVEIVKQVNVTSCNNECE